MQHGGVLDALVGIGVIGVDDIAAARRAADEIAHHRALRLGWNLRRPIRDVIPYERIPFGMRQLECGLSRGAAVGSRVRPVSGVMQLDARNRRVARADCINIDSLAGRGVQRGNYVLMLQATEVGAMGRQLQVIAD